MDNVITISGKKPGFPSMDYDFLRKKGIKHIEKLAGKVWTDYNTHDPGITLMELLCYAITDLGYRTNFELKDIIANNPKSTDSSKDFYTAREILPCNPVTINDFRKIIIDADGIKNAWLEMETTPEVPFYVDLDKKELSYTSLKVNNTPLPLNGLYNVLIEFSEDEVLEDLNDNSQKYLLAFESESGFERLNGLEINIDINFPYWDDQNIDWGSPDNIFENAQSLSLKINKKPADVKVSIIIESTINIEVIILDEKTLGTDRIPELEQFVMDKLKTIILTDPDKSLVSLYQAKIKKIKEIVNNVKERLHKYRNLCEDFVNFKSLKVEEIAICGNIDIRPEAFAEKVLAEIYYKIEKFIAPDITFYTLEELLEKGKSPDQIFEGPVLDKGFIDDEELNTAKRRKAIHVSDIINIIMGTEGVIAVKDLQLSNFPDMIDSSLSSATAKWCLRLSFEKFYTGRFSQELSKIVFYKNKIPYFADLQKVKTFYEGLKKKNAATLLSDAVNDFPIEQGQFKDISAYYSIRNHLPLTYGIGKFGLSESDSRERKAQAKQLKAYLLFFEQLLANYFTQLSKLKDLFSMNKDVARTYFTSPLTGIDDLLIDPAGYPKELEKICESESVFTDRRNRFLDHLLARFAEQFTDYALLMYTMAGDEAKKELIVTKLDFLNSYPEISNDRGRSFNYRDSSNVWDTSNVEGLKKRLCRLAGIHDYNRQYLAYLKADELIEVYKDKNKQWRFRLKDESGKIIFVGEAYTTKHNCLNGIESCKTNGIDKQNYKALIAKNYKYYFTLVAQNYEIIGNSPVFKTEQERNEAIVKMVQYLTPGGNKEGFHIVEHILLRPKYATDHFLHVDLEEPCYCIGDEDPYSFRISIVLPGWVDRFKDAHFRNFFERTLRTEAPAHIMLRICWVSAAQMYSFERAYHEWLTENATENPVSHEWSEKLSNLISTMQQLRNIHPPVTLYDCKEIQDQNPATLDNTILGQI